MGQGLLGGGIATLYFSAFAASGFYHLISMPAAFTALIAISVLAGFIAVRFHSILTAVPGVIGGYGTPVMLSTGQVNFPGLYGYMLVLGLGVLCICAWKRFRLPGLISIVVFGLVAAAVAEEPQSFHCLRPVNVPENSNDELFAVDFDSDIYADSRDGFPDFRVYNADQRLVPFLIRHVSKEQSRTIQKSWPAKNVQLRPIEEEGLEIRVSLTDDDQLSPGGLRFVTSLTNFEQKVTVYVTTNGDEQLIVDGAVIFDYMQFMDVRKTEVPLPPTTGREFRIVVGKLTADVESPFRELTRVLKNGQEDQQAESSLIVRRPFRIDRLEFWKDETIPAGQVPVIQPWPVDNVKVSHDAKNKMTLVDFTSRREPLTSVTLLTSSRNFSRHAEVQVGSDSAMGIEYSTIGQATISRFQLRNFREDVLNIPLNETRHTRYRVVIHNGDSPELEIESVTATGHQHQAVFLREPNQSIHLAYGSSSAHAPNQDTSALTMAVGRHLTPVVATLAAQTRSELVPPQAEQVRNLLTDPVFLGTAVVVLVVIFGWGLYQAGRRIDKLPHGDPE